MVQDGGPCIGVRFGRARFTLDCGAIVGPGHDQYDAMAVACQLGDVESLVERASEVQAVVVVDVEWV